MPKPVIKPTTPRKIWYRAVMKVVPGLSSASVAPALKDKDRGQIVYRELINSGSAVDGRKYTPEIMRELFKNTKSILFDEGVILPVKEGHIEQTNELLRGFVNSIELVEDGDLFSIWGKVFLFEPYYSAFKNGQLPNVSVEIDAEGTHVNGGSVGPYLSAVSMLGQTQPAFPGLKVFSKNVQKAFSTLHGAIITFSKMFDSQKFQSGGTMEMDKEKLAEVVANLRGTADWLEEYLGGAPEEEASTAEGGEAETAAKNKKKEDEAAKLAKENAELKAKLSAKHNSEETDKEFAKLIAENKARATDKERFVKLVTSHDMEFAKSNFANVLPAPAQSGELGSVRNVELSEKQKVERALFRKMKISEEEIDRLMGIDTKGVAK